MLRAQPHRLAVDVDVIDARGAGGYRQLADHSLAGADDEHVLDLVRQQQRRHQQGLVVDELAELGALPLSVAEQRDALFRAADHQMLEFGAHVADDFREPPSAGKPRCQRLDDIPGRGSASEIRWQRRESIERHGRVACGVGAGVRDFDPIACPQRDGERIPLVEHVVAVTCRSGYHRVVDGIALAVGPQPVTDVLVLGFGEAAVATDIEVYPAPAIGPGAHRYYLAADAARRTDNHPSRLHYELRWVRTEMEFQRGHDGVGHKA